MVTPLRVFYFCMQTTLVSALAWVLSMSACSSATLAQEAPAAANYAWLADMEAPLPSTVPLSERFPAPAGFERVEVPTGSFSSWLRDLPVRTDRTQVLSYRGERLARPSAAVLLVDVGSRDLMQCADSILRLHAEYLWSDGRSREAAYRFTSGDETRWADWTRGERFVIRGNQVERKTGAARPSHHGSYRAWLDLVFTYAGTTSLARDTPSPAPASPVAAGDFYVDPGFPGHAVLVLDVVEKGTVRLGLIGQGFMPAEEIHVLKSEQAVEGTWFPLPDASHPSLATPSWRPFLASARRRFP